MSFFFTYIYIIKTQTTMKTKLTLTIARIINTTIIFFGLAYVSYTVYLYSVVLF